MQRSRALEPKNPCANDLSLFSAHKSLPLNISSSKIGKPSRSFNSPPRCSPLLLCTRTFPSVLAPSQKVLTDKPTLFSLEVYFVMLHKYYKKATEAFQIVKPWAKTRQVHPCIDAPIDRRWSYRQPSLLIYPRCSSPTHCCCRRSCLMHSGHLCPWSSTAAPSYPVDLVTTVALRPPRLSHARQIASNWLRPRVANMLRVRQLRRMSN